MIKHLVLVAGGKGLRMGSELPKQFILLNGKPLLMHTIDAFLSVYPDLHLVLVLPELQIDYWRELCKQYQFRVPHDLALGGSTRFHSVKAGLSLVPSDGLVAVHDAVRPLVSEKTIRACFETAEIKGNAVPVVPIHESIRWVNGETNKRVNRSEFFAVQTPQVFKVEQLKKAYLQAFTDAFTDDASVVEKEGHSISLVNGNTENIKITLPSDLKMAEFLLG